MFRMQNKSPTPIETLIRAKKIAHKIGLNYCYIGNIMKHENINTETNINLTNTLCPKCNKIVIERKGYDVHTNLKIEDRKEKSVENGKIFCECGFEIYGKA